MGNLLRRYWHPIAGVSEFDEQETKPVRIMGEDLVLYKDLSGTYGLIDRQCQHRRADLSYGFVEECGLRCNYHGWLYDEKGACIAQPYEDTAHPEAKFKDKVKIKAYPVQPLAGLLWAYMGPEPAPLLPNWEPFTWDNGFVQVVLSDVPCNWFQCAENCIDPVHFEWMHSNWSIRLSGKTGPYIPKHLKVDFKEHEFGLTYHRIAENTDENNPLWTVGRMYLWPNCLFTGEHFEWRTPIDDEKHAVGRLVLQPGAHGTRTLRAKPHSDMVQPGQGRGDRALDHQPCHEPGFRRLGRTRPDVGSRKRASRQ